MDGQAHRKQWSTNSSFPSVSNNQKNATDVAYVSLGTEAKDNGGRKEGEESAQPEIDTVGQSNNEPEACRRLEGEHSNHETRTSKINPIAFATQAGDTIHLQQAMKQPDKMQFLKAMEEEVMTHGR